MKRGIVVVLVLLLCVLNFTPSRGQVAASASTPTTGNVALPSNADEGSGSASLSSCSNSGACHIIGTYTNNRGYDEVFVDSIASGFMKSTELPVRSTNGEDYSVAGLSCPTGSWCMAAFNNGFVDIDNDGKWSIAPEDPFQINAISCWAAEDCAAVGSNSDSEPAVSLFASGAWTRPVVLSQSQVNGNGMNQVSCPAIDWCASAGVVNGRQLFATMSAGRWTIPSTAFTQSPTASKTDLAEGGISALACMSKDKCAAVGNYEDTSTNGGRGFVADLSNGTWHEQQSPKAPNGASAYNFAYLACSASSCLAADNSTQLFPVIGDFQPINTSEWNGSSWRSAVIAPPGDFSENPFDLFTDLGVACSATTCSVQSAYVNFAKQNVLLGAYLRGSTWSTNSVLLPSDNRIAPNNGLVGCYGNARCYTIMSFYQESENPIPQFFITTSAPAPPKKPAPRPMALIGAARQRVESVREFPSAGGWAPTRFAPGESIVIGRGVGVGNELLTRSPKGELLVSGDRSDERRLTAHTQCVSRPRQTLAGHTLYLTCRTSKDELIESHVSLSSKHPLIKRWHVVTKHGYGVPAIARVDKKTVLFETDKAHRLRELLLSGHARTIAKGCVSSPSASTSSNGKLTFVVCRRTHGRIAILGNAGNEWSRVFTLPDSFVGAPAVAATDSGAIVVAVAAKHHLDELDLADHAKDWRDLGRVDDDAPSIAALS